MLVHSRIISCTLGFLLMMGTAITVVGQPVSLKPSGLQQQQHITLEVGDMKVVFVDNSAFGSVHRSGYNGIASWEYRKHDSVLFVPSYAGFNLEHIFGGDSLQQLFEPRLHPMSLFRKNDREVVLYQSPTPLSAVESVTEFKLVAPHYVDIRFRCMLHSDTFFRHGYAGLFWASYIQQPSDKKIYFFGTRGEDRTPSWITAATEKHGVNSTHRNRSDSLDLFFAENFNATLASHFSGYRYTERFYYGRSGNMCFAYLFAPGAVIRFSQSPNGGGELNPAWDFQWIIPHPQVDRVYSFSARLVYKPFVSEEDIRKEYMKWRKMGLNKQHARRVSPE